MNNSSRLQITRSPITDGAPSSSSEGGKIHHQPQSQTSPNTLTAATRALGVGEILEMILVYLPFKDLLLSQRVAPSWKVAIDASAKLQQALFLKPRPAKYAWLHDHSHCNPDEFGSPAEDDEGNITMPYSGFVRKVSLGHCLSPEQILSGQFSIKKSGYLHPLYENVCEGNLNGRTERDQTAGKLRRNKVDGRFLPSEKHSEASWKKMYWCQPPSRHAQSIGSQPSKFLTRRCMTRPTSSM